MKIIYRLLFGILCYTSVLHAGLFDFDESPSDDANPVVAVPNGSSDDAIANPVGMTEL
jgi:hypothetical protein